MNKEQLLQALNGEKATAEESLKNSQDGMAFLQGYLYALGFAIGLVLGDEAHEAAPIIDVTLDDNVLDAIPSNQFTGKGGTFDPSKMTINLANLED